MKKSLLAAVSAACIATAHLAPTALADEDSRLPQPNPAGSVLDGHLSEINDKGAYFADKPYTEQAASRAVGQLLNAGFMCTGSVIDSPSGTLVVTAAHCLGDFKDGSWQISQATRDSIAAGNTTFTPAFDGTAGTPEQRTPLGSWKVTNAHVSETSGVDVAVLEIAPDAQGRTIQEVTGAFGVKELQQGETVQASLIGYPGPAPFNGQSQSVCVGNYTKHEGGGNSQIRRVDGERECWVGGGASGGPYATTSTNPALAGEIITVLNSNGGGNIGPVVRELMGNIEGELPQEETTEAPKPEQPTEEAKPAEKPADPTQEKPEQPTPEQKSEGANPTAPNDKEEAPKPEPPAQPTEEAKPERPAEPKAPVKGIDPAQFEQQPQAPVKGIAPAMV
ncbi:trypsin-like serine peptidase [Corynebacterium sp. 22KM0430]|uniref:trypsin-like serine peptidase n=1 Tax=Corynebacterium sp. 22KM0430 TaxID=2989735 RepID=UPI0029CA5B4A|nr:trypsin-like peptidase domain-containing protein [Corynebacterium sp. 22KM0430]WPF65491.1 trypsin-like peptidase domain-containing protein [Corynebacterium sp. 22KM0430]